MSLEAMLQTVSFSIGAEVFAVSVEQVREILDYQQPFRLPSTPEWFLGLIDVRGQGVPAIDLRLRMGLPSVPPTPMTRILIVEARRGETKMLLGLVIDRALVVSAFSRDMIESAPDMADRWRWQYVTGVVRQNGHFMAIVDIDLILSSEDSHLVDPDLALHSRAA